MIGISTPTDTIKTLLPHQLRGCSGIQMKRIDFNDVVITMGGK